MCHEISGAFLLNLWEWVETCLVFVDCRDLPYFPTSRFLLFCTSGFPCLLLRMSGYVSDGFFYRTWFFT